jgi:hypothetical protein
MTPERMAALVLWWVRLYTRNLADPIARRRLAEIDADLRDQITHERADGASDRRLALGILSRMVRGLGADVAWRERQAKRDARAASARTRPLRRSAARVALGVAIVLALPLTGMLVSDGVDWSLADFAAAGIFLTAIGVALEVAVRRAGNRVTAAGIAAVGTAAVICGEAGDAPGLVLLGVLLVGSAVALAVRAAPGS